MHSVFLNSNSVFRQIQSLWITCELGVTYVLARLVKTIGFYPHIRAGLFLGRLLLILSSLHQLISTRFVHKVILEKASVNVVFSSVSTSPITTITNLFRKKRV